jgi:hypothetical protein
MTVRVGLSETVLLFEQTISARLFQSGGLPASIHHAGAFKGSGRTDHPNGGRRENVVSAGCAAEGSAVKCSLSASRITARERCCNASWRGTRKIDNLSKGSTQHTSRAGKFGTAG